MKRLSAFALIEMLIVIAIIAILATFSMIGVNKVLNSSRMEQAGRMILDEINLGRQVAASRNRNVEVRFIKQSRDGGEAVFQCIQTGWLDKDGTFQISAPKAKMPDGIILSERTERSSILGALTLKTNDAPVYPYVALIIKPSGFLEPQNGIALNEPWFVSAIHMRDENHTEIHDFVTVQIDPWTSRPTFYRP